MQKLTDSNKMGHLLSSADNNGRTNRVNIISHLIHIIIALIITAFILSDIYELNYYCSKYRIVDFTELTTKRAGDLGSIPRGRPTGSGKGTI